MADVFAPQPVKTKVAGDVVVNINAGQTVGLAAGAATIGAVNINAGQSVALAAGAAAIGSVSVTSLPALSAGAAAIGSVTVTSLSPLVAGSAAIGTVGVTSLPALSAGAAAIGTVGVTALPAIPTGANTIGSVNITAGQTVGLVAGAAVIGSLVANQSVNTTQLGGAAVAVGAGASSAGTQRVIIATDQGTLPVSQGLSFVTSDTGQLTSVALAAGATITLDGVQIASGVGKLFEATVSSSVALKAQLGTWDGTTFIVKRTFFVPANSALLFEPSRYDAITMATSATAKFRWSITNNDNANAADVYASITHAI